MPNSTRQTTTHNFLRFLVACSITFLALATTPSHAQLLPPPAADSTEQASAPAWPEDSLGRRTPRGTVSGFIKAVAREDYAKAANFLRVDPSLQENQDETKLAQALQRLLDQSGTIFPYSLISNDTEGNQEDNLGPNLERVGTATVNGESFDLMLEKVEDSTGAPVWQFSSQTVSRIPLKAGEEISTPLVNKLSPYVLEENKWGGVPVSHWLAILILLIVAYFIAWGITRLVLVVTPIFWHRARTEPTAGIVKAFTLPLRICLTVWVFVAASQQVGLSIIVRQRFSEVTFIVFMAAVLLLLWRLIDATTQFTGRRLAHRNNMAGVSAVLFVRRAFKLALMVIGCIILLDSFGFDVTTGIAALGIGGIALALGAQKTVENFVGSVTLIADQPVRVGDFCKVGDTVGTVEQIGMRSTRIRTLERTIVTIPNGEFSSLKIENYAHRDRFWFHPKFGLRFETSPDQMRYLLVELRKILYAHPKVDPDPARIRFTEIGADSLNLEIFAYVNAIDFNQFLEIQEDLYLRMMDVIEESGTGFAFPSQTLYIAKDQGVSKDKTTEAEEQVRKWRKTGNMQIPNFTPEHISKLSNTIPYPPEGSIMRSKTS
ncbi:mechanosensitive ion channel family protein [Pontibacter korlensis]|uniref:Mechanosensitive ion channel protein MscS n=1 Tax=Pontibacter korlensis TaxID=400092 RepID=A0A0E3ZJ51_9BACT|nr:mechanosensitive ion channel protein MscS [Pontibacter korlensis]